MASVMNQSIQIDEERYAKEQELMSRLLTENKVSFIGIDLFFGPKHYESQKSRSYSVIEPIASFINRDFEKCLRFHLRMVPELTH